MNFVVAKVRKDDKFYKLISGDEFLFDNPEIEEAIEYNSDVTPQEGQWFEIKGFRNCNKYSNDLLQMEWNSTEFKSGNYDLQQIEYICSYQEDNEYLFQRTYKKHFLKKSRLLKIASLGEDYVIEEPKNRIIISDFPDAWYRKEEDILYFRNLIPIKPIFKGIEELYREATREETKAFLEESFIITASDFNCDSVGKLNRKRIASARDVLSEISEKERIAILDYTSTYNPGLEYSDGRFTIHNEDELKNLLYGIEQRYYTTPVTLEPRVAKAVTPVSCG